MTKTCGHWLSKLDRSEVKNKVQNCLLFAVMLLLLETTISVHGPPPHNIYTTALNYYVAVESLSTQA
jgi:hypothetical protein